MACVLKKKDDGSFEGPTEATVTIAVRSDKQASTVKIFYAGTEDGEAPFELRIRPGVNKLLVNALGAENGQKMLVVEVDGANDCRPPLKVFFWSSVNFFTTLDIEGVE